MFVRPGDWRAMFVKRLRKQLCNCALRTDICHITFINISGFN